MGATSHPFKGEGKKKFSFFLPAGGSFLRLCVAPFKKAL
ncbi:hypothetical protein FORC066_4146 [Yersinia enterocolitica]|nr:hypothetical protein FORC065_0381 [Yersinia enterocolitica]UXD31349.1 hypothetical protein FORC066_4146 [Yersinia enterocolitica]